MLPVAAIAVGKVVEGLPIVAGRQSLQQDLQHAAAAETHAPQIVGFRAHVVSYDDGCAGLDHFTCMFGEIAFEAAAAHQSRMLAIRTDQYLPARFAVSRARRVNDCGEHHRSVGLLPLPKTFNELAVTH